jgi:Zn-dependent protease
MQESISVSQGLFPILVAIFSIICHEVAHGYAAYIQGDETAYRAGRLTLNPLPHIDIIGSIVVPLFAFFTGGPLFGWAKPVPYNVYNVKGRFGEAFVASAGVLTNFAIALCAGLAFVFFSREGMLTESFAQALFTVIVVNVSLGVFNLIPVPPFDGIAIIQGLFPRLHINSRVIYNPLYLIGAIIVASVFYQAIAPYVFKFIISLLV